MGKVLYTSPSIGQSGAEYDNFNRMRRTFVKLLFSVVFRAQDIFREALQMSEVCLRLIKASGDNGNRPPAPVYPRLETPSRREGESESGWPESDDKCRQH